MYRVFNMGVGFCVIVPDDGALIARAIEIGRREGVAMMRLGEVLADPSRRVIIEPKRIVGEGDYFHRTA